MDIFEKITHFVQKVFKTNLEIFLEALKLSPNAQGYVSGSITELLLKKKLEEEYGLEVRRIREKWEGRKPARHIMAISIFELPALLTGMLSNQKALNRIQKNGIECTILRI